MSRPWQWLTLALYPLLTAGSLLAGYLFDPADPGRTPLLARLNSLLSGRFEVWHHVYWAFPYTHPAEDGRSGWYHGDMPSVVSLLGGLPSDGDVHHAIDNTYLALTMNKGVLGALLVGGGGAVPAVAAEPRAACGRTALPGGDCSFTC